MNANERQLLALIREGEGVSTEFKACRNQIDWRRECRNAFPGRLIIEYGKVTTYNANRPHGFGVLNPDTFAPYPKNPVIGAFSRQIDRADELGSGMRNMMMYGKKYGGADPQLIEGDVFRMIISVPEFGATEPINADLKSGVESGVESDMTTKVLLLLAFEDLPRSIIAQKLGKPTRYLNDLMKRLLAKKLVEYTIPEKPNSRLQKYRITEKGKAFLERHS